MSNKKTYVVLGITLGTLSLAGFGYWYFKGRNSTVTDTKNQNELLAIVNDEPNIPNTASTSITAPATANGFPLKRHSKGDLVKQIQTELIKKYGKEILPKYGVDGDFGKELEAALVSKGFSKIIDLTEFNKIVAINTAPSETPTSTIPSVLTDSAKEKIDIAKNIWLYSTTKNLTKLLVQLKRIDSTDEYKGVNDLFKTIRLHGVRQTIVNGTLASFSDETSKQLIRQEFTRIGLKYDGDKWTLSGMFRRRLITLRPTTISNRHKVGLDVPEDTMLGVEIESMNGITTFQTINNELLTVPTNHINYV